MDFIIDIIPIILFLAILYGYYILFVFLIDFIKRILNS